MRADQSAGALDEVGDDLVQYGLARIGVNVEYENLVGIETAGPQVLAVVAQPE